MLGELKIMTIQYCFDFILTDHVKLKCNILLWQFFTYRKRALKVHFYLQQYPLDRHAIYLSISIQGEANANMCIMIETKLWNGDAWIWDLII